LNRFESKPKGLPSLPTSSIASCGCSRVRALGGKVPMSEHKPAYFDRLVGFG
jgi:hypothetical protein